MKMVAGRTEKRKGTRIDDGVYSNTLVGSAINNEQVCLQMAIKTDVWRTRAPTGCPAKTRTTL